MCHKTKCRACGKATWAGCGRHVESALRGVRDEDRCPNWRRGYRHPCGDGGGGKVDSGGNDDRGLFGGIFGGIGR
jgi:hypothetical protein